VEPPPSEKQQNLALLAIVADSCSIAAALPGEHVATTLKRLDKA